MSDSRLIEEQAWLEAERAERERVEAERAEWERAEAEQAEREAKEKKACKEEERWVAEHKCKAKTSKGDEAGASGEARGEVKQVVMDPSCTHCAQAKVVCKFLMDSNKKRVACMCCNLSKGKCQWPGDGKDAEAGPKVKANKGKERKPNDEMPEPRLSQKKWAKSKVVEVLEIDEPKAGGSGAGKASAAMSLGLEEKLEQLIDTVGMIANNLAGLFELQEAMVENSSRIAYTLELLLNESYGFGMAVSPLDLGSSELDSNELREEAKWLKAHGKDEEEGTEGEDETMAEAK
ncbi:hypothetical protein M404DRAFT_21788 [Pisolithus tinctorius Marx 270]|uniref:Zn(2)-C6 fungal-type domain-containing protein n=1 Tax=Pisolithus tinctorius Marx 270 TaxID=870435 RepID=A0A0C3JLR1_PISTI|nr:hypothetical protein M404DRAFT_21788 [Pisolithus tinctorius Marx 270]